MLLNTWSNFICTPYYVERYEKLEVRIPSTQKGLQPTPESMEHPYKRDYN